MNLNLLGKVRVIESSAFIAAPLAGMTLAQCGADVIRIDAINGGIDYARMPIMPGGRSLYWTGLNKGKRSVCVDIRGPEGRELVTALATAPGPDAGVLLTNIGVPWLSHAALASRRADMISCTIEGNPDGTSAVDYTVNCASGFPMMTGNGSVDQPVNHVLPAWDLACAYQAAFAISAGLLRRAATGAGAELRIALSDVAFATLSNLGMLSEAELLDRERPALGNYLYGAFGRDFATADGHRVFVTAISLGQWRNLVKACGLQAQIEQLQRASGKNFDNEADRYEAREDIAALVEHWCKKHALQQIESILTEHGACWGRYQTVRGALASDPRVSEANPVFDRIDTAGVGRHLAAGTSIRLAGHPRYASAPAPVLGQDTDEVLMEVLGLGSAEVGKLHDRGVVAGPERDPFVGTR